MAISKLGNMGGGYERLQDGRRKGRKSKCVAYDDKTRRGGGLNVGLGSYNGLNVDSLEDFDVRVVISLEVGVTAVSAYNVLLNSTLDIAHKLLLILLLHVLSARWQHRWVKKKFVA